MKRLLLTSFLLLAAFVSYADTTIPAAATATATTSTAIPPADFTLRDSDTVVFMGDSITAAQTYGKIIENYTLLRYPERRVRFINAGKGGETAQDGLRRLERDVFAAKATVLTVAFGVNDIGWGMRADEKHRNLYLDAVREIVARCRERGVRVVICSAAITGADPFKSETDFLQTMCDEGMAISRSLGGDAIDVQRTMRAINRKMWEANAAEAADAAKAPANSPAGTAKPGHTLHEADTIHLNETGQIAMAYAILKGLGAPADVSSATLDAAGLQAAAGCTISDLASTTDTLTFTRHDQGWPLSLGLIGHLADRWVPLKEDLGRLMLTVQSLPPGRYTVTADGRKLGEWDAGQLSAGINLGSATPDPWTPGGPWDVQGTLLRELTDARSKIAYTNRLLHLLTPDSPDGPDHVRSTGDIITRLESLQRETARSRPVRFVVKPSDAANTASAIKP